MGRGEHNTVSTFTGEILSLPIQRYMNPVTDTIFTLKTAFRVVTPKKLHVFNKEYSDAWNDCLKEIKKRQRKLIKGLEELSTHYETE